MSGVKTRLRIALTSLLGKPFNAIPDSIVRAPCDPVPGSLI